MTIYGPGGGRPSKAHRLGRRTPRALRVERQASGGIRHPISFSSVSLKSGEDLSNEEAVSARHFQSQGREESHATKKATVIEEKTLQEVVQKASRSCERCKEFIPGSSPYFVRITLRIPSVGAEATECIIQSICEACTTPENSTAQKVPPQEALPTAWKNKLNPRQLDVWNRCEELKDTQQAVAADFGLKQYEISRILTACRKIRDQFLAQTV